MKTYLMSSNVHKLLLALLPMIYAILGFLCVLLLDKLLEGLMFGGLAYIIYVFDHHICTSENEIDDEFD